MVQMLATAAAVVQDERMARVQSSPSLTSEQKAAAMISVCEDELNDAGRNYISLLAENGRIYLLPAIQAQFEQLKARQEASVEIDVTTAFELDEQQQQKLSQAIGTKLGRSVKMTTQVDKSILGGVVIRSEDLVIDGSVRARLAKLAETMSS